MTDMMISLTNEFPEDVVSQAAGMPVQVFGPSGEFLAFGKCSFTSNGLRTMTMRGGKMVRAICTPDEVARIEVYAMTDGEVSDKRYFAPPVFTLRPRNAWGTF